MNRQKSLLPIIVLTLVTLLAIGYGPSSTAQANCPEIYRGGNGWVMDMCYTDPEVATPMQVVLDGVSQGNAALMRVYHKSQAWPGTPQVAVIYASGFVRLKQNADPAPPVPFGSSFILGPAYWPNLSTYYHNPQLNRLEINTTWLPNAPLRMEAEGTNHDFDVTYKIELPPPRDRQTRLHVTQTYTATASITINSTRRAESQGFKLVQVSSMFINEGGVCEGGNTDCHDSDAARYIGANLVRRQVAFSSLTPPSFVFSTPQPLGSTWLDVLHTDDNSWQGNTPNVRIALDALLTDHTVTPQGWIGVTTSPNDDNVNLWLHDDGSASQSWTASQSDQISYWLLAQDDPPEPWTELGLRSGSTFLDFEGSYNCFPVLPGPPVTGSVASIAGYTDTALQLSYGLGSDNSNWAQVRCNFNPPQDLSAYDHLRLDWRGDPKANRLEVGVTSRKDGVERNFIVGYPHVTHRSWWGQLVIPFDFFPNNTNFNPAEIVAFFVSVKVVKDPTDGVEDDVGGAGSIAIDNLSAYNVISRTVPTTFETVTTNLTASIAAANWLAGQQQTTGLLKSWEEEGPCLAHTYDQALALIVFSNESMWTEADALVDALATVQNPDGSWFQSRYCSTQPVGNNKWEGDIAWAVYALSRYLALGGTHPLARPAMEKGTAWLTTRLAADGCLVIDHTEGSIDVWWALQAAGPAYTDEAEALENCLLTYYWDEEMGRFKGGKNWWQPYLDNQTWGAAFLKAICEWEKARRALSYAREVLRLPAQGGQLFGFDGQAGPWSVWNDGTGQYIAAGGDGADDLLLELLAQQREDGAMPGSPGEFGGGSVWTTRWHGVAPTAWLYNALNSEPFHPAQCYCPSCIYVPIVLKNYAP